MEENKQVVAEWKALNQPRLQEIKKANPELYSAVNLALQYLNTKLGGEELPAEVEVEEEVVETTPMQTKQWVKEDFFNTKIILDTPEKSKKFQEFVFGLGIRWANGENKPTLLDKKYLEIDGIGMLTYTSNKDNFDKFLSNEIFYDDIFPEEKATKKWTFADFLDKKIIVDTPEKSKKFQELVFSLGIKWTSGENDSPLLLNEKYILIDMDGEMIVSSTKDNFDSSLKEEIYYDDIFPPQTATKQWTLDDFKNIKIIVDTPEKSRKFQELFLGLGGEWSRIDNPRPTEVANTNKLYLVTNGKKLLFFNELKVFNEQTDLKEIFYDDIFNSATSQKTLTKDDFLNKKIVLDTEDKSRKFQEFVYSLGLQWMSGENKTPILLDKKYIKISDHGNLSFTEYKKTFDADNKQEIFYDYIFPSESQTTTPEPPTSTQQKKYGLPIETYPTYFSFPIPGFSANTGDRKSPTQSAGELRRWYFTLGNVAQIEYARELDRARFKGNDGNWYALVTGKSGVWSWKKTTPPPTQYTPPAASSSSSSSASTSFSSTSSAQPAQPVATKKWKPEDLVGKKLLWSGREYDVVKFRRNNPKYKSYTLRNANGIELEGKLTMGAIDKLLNDEPVKNISIIKPKTEPTPASSFEDSLTSLSDAELKQLYDDTEAAKAEFDAADPEYTELRLQLVAIANEMDNRNL